MTFLLLHSGLQSQAALAFGRKTVERKAGARNWATGGRYLPDEYSQMKTRYKFSHRAGNTYYWYAVKPLIRDSSSELIFCNVDWFWGQL